MDIWSIRDTSPVIAIRFHPLEDGIFSGLSDLPTTRECAILTGGKLVLSRAGEA